MGLAGIAVGLTALGTASSVASSISQAGAYSSQAKAYRKQRESYEWLAQEIEDNAEREARWIELQGDVSRWQAKYVEGMGVVNKALALLEAESIDQAVEVMEASIYKEGAEFIGRAVAGYGAANVQFSGTPVQVIRKRVREVEEEAALVVHKGRTESAIQRLRGDMIEHDAKLQAEALRFQGRGYDFSAYQTRRGGIFDAYRARLGGYEAELNAWNANRNAALSWMSIPSRLAQGATKIYGMGNQAGWF